MSLADTRFDQLFPVFNAADRDDQAFCQRPGAAFRPGELIYDVGQRNVPSWLVLEGVSRSSAATACTTSRPWCRWARPIHR